MYNKIKTIENSGKLDNKILSDNSFYMRYFDNITLKILKQQLTYFDVSTIRTIHIIAKFSEQISKNSVEILLEEYKRLKQIIVYNAPNNIKKEMDLQAIYIFTKDNINDETCCGNVSPFYFQANIDFYKESRIANNCLDKKICIDKKGYIKNCPSMQNNYGHINNTLIAEVIQNKDFQKIWHIKKDNIDVCKDCEFRYMCLDCRVYISD